MHDTKMAGSALGLTRALVCSCILITARGFISVPPSQHSLKNTVRVSNVKYRLRTAKAPLLSQMTDAGSILSPPPSTFAECVSEAYVATTKAIDEGRRLMEIEFPPLPLEYLEGTAASAYDCSRANIRLAIDVAKKFVRDGKRVSVILPDNAEVDIAVESEGNPPFPNVTIACIRTNSVNNAATFDQLLGAIFGSRQTGQVEPLPNVDVYIACVFSAQELPDLRALHEKAPDAPIIFFNLKLDQLRGDLGAPAFPSQELHYEFLSKIKPTYLLKPKSYFVNIPKPPFLINFSGGLFRKHPEHFQILLDAGQGRYRAVHTTPDRPAANEVRVYLTKSLQIDELGASSRELEMLEKSKTWWEKNNSKETSADWRT